MDVAVLGAGGTARAAVAALASCGATVIIYNRTLERAEAVVEQLKSLPGKIVATKLEKLCESCCEIFINTTSVGMHPDVDESAWGEMLPKLSTSSLVFDAVYNPMETRFLRQAQAAGALTIGGVDMFVRQAARQFELFTGLEPPVAAMRAVIHARLQ